MINKRIFYVWGAGEKKKRDVQVCIQTWRQIMPDYEIIEINEESKTYFDFQQELQNNRWFRTVYELKMWAYVADYIRIKTLYDNGGIYFDTDVSAVKTLDPFLNEPAFVGMQNNSVETDNNYVEPAILGAQKHNKFLKHILDFYDQDIWQQPIFTMPQIFEFFLQKQYQLNSFPAKKNQVSIHLKDITISPERFFIPFRYQEEFTPKCVEEDTHTIHWFGGSWTKPEVIHWLMNKHNPEFLKQPQETPPTRQPVAYWQFKIFKIIPFIRIKAGPKKTNVRLWGFIPLFSLKKQWLYLFDLIPFIRLDKKGEPFQ